MEYTYIKETSEMGNEYLVRSDGAFIPSDPANSDYQAYLEHLTESVTKAK